jgi:pre-mRNA-processing factor 19
MSITHCALSGNALLEPVVSIPTGHIYEKSVILAHILKTGRCPLTNSSLSESDLIELKSNPISKPKPLSSSSFPGLLQTLQEEWNATVLENHSLKKQNELLREELSHSLYQFDAACRVLSRLVNEKEDLVRALQDLSRND